MCSANVLPMLKISHTKPRNWNSQHSHVVIWLVVSTPLENISQLGWLFPIYGKIKHVPNHQPVIVVVLWLWARHESQWLHINAVNVTWVPEYSKTNHKHTRLRPRPVTNIPKSSNNSSNRSLSTKTCAKWVWHFSTHVTTRMYFFSRVQGTPQTWRVKTSFSL